MGKPAPEMTFTPAVSFRGYPDDVTPVNYQEGKPASAPAEYVALLRRKGLVADQPAASAEQASTTEAAA